MPRGLGKNRNQFENQFFRAGTSIFSPWKPPKPTRTQSKTQPHRGTGRGGAETHPDCSPSTPGRLGVREKFGNRPGTCFSVPESSFRAPKRSKTRHGRPENPASPPDGSWRAPEPPRELPRLPRTSRGVGKIREATGDQFFGAGLEVLGFETLEVFGCDPETQPHRGTDRGGP